MLSLKRSSFFLYWYLRKSTFVTISILYAKKNNHLSELFRKLELLWKFQVLHTNAIPWKFQVHASRILCIPWNLHGHTPRILCLKFKLFLFCHDLDLQIKRNAGHNWMTWHLKSEWTLLPIMMQESLKCFCFLTNGIRIYWETLGF